MCGCANEDKLMQDNKHIADSGQSSKRLVVLGAGESGAGAAFLAQQQGYDVFVSDFGAIADHYKQQLVDWNIRFEEKQHTEDEILAAIEVIKSPGIPEKAPIIKKIKEKASRLYQKLNLPGDIPM